MSSETDMEVESPHVENTHTELLWVLWVMYFLDVTFWIHFHWTEGQFRWLERYTKTDIELGIPFHNVQHAFTRFFLLIKITTDEMWFWISWNYCDFLTRLCQKPFTCTRVKFVCSWIPWKLLESVKIGIFKIVFFYQYKFSAL